MTEKRPQNCGTGYCSCIECPYEAEQVHTPYCKQAPMCKTPCGNSDCVEQAEQERVAWSQERKRNLIKHWALDCSWDDLTEREIDDLELLINAALNAAPVQQAEQEPVAIDELARACNLAGIEYKDFLRIKAHLPIAAPVQQVEQEPVAVVDPFYIRQLDDELELGTKLYAAPVRTKELTDDEIAQAVGSPLDEVYLADFRAVIAADRRKNR